MYRAVESSVTMTPYNSMIGTSCHGTFGILCLANIQTEEVSTIPTHLNTCSSRSGILLCSSWTFVTPTTCIKTNMNAARIPIRLCTQGLCCASCSVPWPCPCLDPLSWCRSLSDSFVMLIFLLMSPPRFRCIPDDSSENHHHYLSPRMSFPSCRFLLFSHWVVGPVTLCSQLKHSIETQKQ